MGCKYALTSLADIATIATGKSNRQDAIENGEYAFFDRSQEIKRSSRYLFDAKAVIVPGEGQEFIPRYYEGKFDLHQRVYAIIPNETIDPRYVYYAVRNGRAHFANVAVGSTVKSLRLASFETMKIPLPDRRVQARIAFMLGELDLKIELNNQLNDYLEQLCQSLFDRFDRDGENPFVSIGDIAEVNPKRSIKKGEEALCVEMADLSTRGSFPSGWRMKPYNGGMKFVNGDTIMARITPCLENGKTGYVNFLEEGQTAFGSTEYIVMASKGSLPPEYFYFLARNADFVAYAAAHMNGSSGRQRVSGADIEKYEVRMPNEEQLREFKQVAIPAMEKILANSLENRKLAELRDALLPKLVSGEIDVSKMPIPTQLVL